MRRIIVTGGHSGLGYAALSHFIKNPPATLPPPYHIIMYARNPSEPRSLRAADELNAMAAASAPGTNVELRYADLAKLPTVRTAARTLLSELRQSRGRVSAFFFNAALAKAKKELVVDEDESRGESWPARRSSDLRDDAGIYETTALVNHVAHLVFLQMLLPYVLAQPPEPTDAGARAGIPLRILFTGSALHRSVQDLDSLEEWFNPRFACDAWSLTDTYAASKFLQLLGVQRLVRLLERRISTASTSSGAGVGAAADDVEVVVCQPGFVPQTGLGREAPSGVRTVMGYVLPWLPLPFLETPEGAGRTLAEALAKPLDRFPLDTAKGRDGLSLSPLEAGGSSSDASVWLPPTLVPLSGEDGKATTATATTGRRVQAALVARGGKLQRPDPRTYERSLQERWWPLADAEVDGQQEVPAAERAASYARVVADGPSSASQRL